MKLVSKGDEIFWNSQLPILRSTVSCEAHTRADDDEGKSIRQPHPLASITSTSIIVAISVHFFALCVACSFCSGIHQRGDMRNADRHVTSPISQHYCASLLNEHFGAVIIQSEHHGAGTVSTALRQ